MNRGGGRRNFGGGRGGGRGGGGRWRGGGRGRGRGGRNNGNFRPQERGPDNTFIEETGTPSDTSVCIAIEGCCHGELDGIYDRLLRQQEKMGRKIDLLLCCGDFQSLRNTADFHSLAVPPKYRALGSFYKYYGGEKQAPILTLFVGGNHEASQALHELYYGGWVAPSIYYLGAAGVVSFRGIRIGGISGIYKSHDYLLGNFEQPPYDRFTQRSVYHVRNATAYRMKCFANATSSNPLDVMISHDWPRGIEQHGNTEDLLKKKPFFREEVNRNDLGSQPNEELLNALRPKWWFAAHLHVKFKATVRYGPTEAAVDTLISRVKPVSLVPSQVIKSAAGSPTSKNTADGTISNSATVEAKNTQDTDSAKEQDGTTTTTQFHSLESRDPCAGPDLTELMTQFLSLDKCLPRRHCLSIVHLEPQTTTPASAKEDCLQYDPAWLAVLKKTHHLSSTQKIRVQLPDHIMPITPQEIHQVQSASPDALKIDPDWFERTVPAHLGQPHPLPHPLPPPFPAMGNPQTDRLLQQLELEHIVTLPYASAKPAEMGLHQDEMVLDYKGDEGDANEIDLDDDDDDEVDNSDSDKAPQHAQVSSTSADGEKDFNDEATKRPRLNT